MVEGCSLLSAEKKVMDGFVNQVISTDKKKKTDKNRPVPKLKRAGPAPQLHLSI